MKVEMPVEIDFGSLLIVCRGKPEIGKSVFGKNVEYVVQNAAGSSSSEVGFAIMAL